MTKLIKSKALFLITIILTSIFSVINFSSQVSAQQACCEKTKTGETCLYTEESNCDLNVRSQNLKNTCDKATYCQLGCCIDKTSSNCFKNTPQAACQDPDKIFKTSADCSVDECSQGCCVLGSQCFLGTEANCKKSFKALFKDNQFEFDFREVASELECTNVCRAQEKGCCVSSTEDTCKFITRDECQVTDNFESGKFCSSINDCGECTPKKSKKCFEDDVYYVDSCGNLEDKAEDCDYNKGTVCSDKNSEPKCISINCEKTYDSPSMDNDGVPRKNGESWCSYDGKTGLGFDLVGSRHYRHMCVNGEEIIEPCRDFREEICINAEVNLPSGSTYIEAQCKQNNFIDCITTCNQAKPDFPNFKEKILDDKKCCENSLRTCVWAGDDENGKCIPAVPPGFRFWELGQTQSRQVSSFTGGTECSSASTSCQVLYEKKPFGDWECKGNCICETDEWLTAMNTHCRSIGDCGAHYNIVGKYTTEGFSESSEGTLPQQPFTDYSIESKGLNIKPLSPDAEQQVGFAAWMEDESAVATAITGLVLLGIEKLVTKIALHIFTKGYLPSMTFLFGDLGTKAASELAATQLAESFLGHLLFAVQIVGWVLLAYSVTKLILELLTNRLVSTKIIECRPWVAPTGGSDCDKCNQPSKECSEYRCRSLGQNCKIVNEGTVEVKCFDSNPNDANSPLISPDSEVLTKGYTLAAVESGFKISPKINPFAPIRFGIKTHELAICKISDIHTKTFDEMANNIGDGIYRKEHNTTLSLMPGKDFTFFIRCQDASGNKNNREYLINFETQAGPDLTPPVIESSSLKDGTKLNADFSSMPLTLFVSEPVNCKFDTRDNDFELLNNNLGCALPLEYNFTFYKSAECQTVLNIEKQKINNFFFRCRDLANNTNQESFKLSLISTENLSISDTTPKGEIFATNLTLLVSTQGGADSGIANCRFSEQNTVYENMIEFLNTDTQLSQQPLTLILGNYTFFVKCRDSADNLASSIISFEVKADTLPPLITGIYKETTKLFLSTNEISTCFFAQDNSANATRIAENSKQFSVDLNLIHFIQCTDIFNNQMQKIKVITN